MSVVKVNIVLEIEERLSYELADALRDYAEEQHLSWRVSRLGGNKVRIVETHDPVDEFAVASLEALSQTIQEAEMALAALGTVKIASVISRGDLVADASDDEGGEEY